MSRVIIPVYFAAQLTTTSSTTEADSDDFSRASFATSTQLQRSASRKAFVWHRLSKYDRSSAAFSLNFPVSVSTRSSTHSSTREMDPSEDLTWIDEDIDSKENESQDQVLSIVLAYEGDDDEEIELPQEDEPQQIEVKVPPPPPLPHSCFSSNSSVYLNVPTRHDDTPSSPSPSTLSTLSARLCSKFHVVTRRNRKWRSEILPKKMATSIASKRARSNALTTIFGVNVDPNITGKCFGVALDAFDRSFTGIREWKDGDDDPVLGLDCYDALPLLARRCLEYLEIVGIKEEGIYR